MRFVGCGLWLFALVMVALLSMDIAPWRWWWTLEKPMPVAGEVWCAAWDGDPWHRTAQRVYVLEVQAAWIRYALGQPDGWDRTSKLWIFRSNYHPCP